LNSSSSNTANQQSLYNWALLGLIALIWGSSYILIKKGLVAFSPEQLACLRIGISALAFLPVFLYKLKSLDWSKLKYLLIVGFTGSGIPAFLFAIAQTEINSSLTGILSSSTPLFTLFWGVLLFRVEWVWMKALGVLVGLCGAAILMFFGKEAGVEGNLWYGLLVILGCMLYALSVNTVKVYLQEMEALTISATTFFFIGIPAIIYLTTTDFIMVMKTDSMAWTSLGFITILSLVGTVLATILFFHLVQRTNAIWSSMVSYLIPIVALMWGSVDGEPILYIHFIGMLLILAGVYITRN